MLALEDMGPDYCDRRIDRLHALLRSELLTHDQTLRMLIEQTIVELPLEIMYIRMRLLRKIESEGLAPNLEEVKSSKDWDNGRIVVRPSITTKFDSWYVR